MTLFCNILIAEEPWGTDADLLCPCRSPCEKPVTFTGYVAEGIIRFHQRVISEADGPRSHFRPTSSQYMLDAIQTHGFLCGYAMGCDRLMRENCELWIYPVITAENGTLVKWDPVKPARCEAIKR
jgi:uncharacterized protein